MLKRWQGGLATALVTLVTLALVILDITDGGFRRWWADRALTTATVAGVLVLLITVLVVNQVVGMRQVRDRSQATAAQAAIVMAQAVRSSKPVSSVRDGSGDRDTASDEVRTYMTMLLIAAPVLIDAKVPRQFLEQAQHLGAELAHELTSIANSPAETTRTSDRLDAAVKSLRKASTPLLQTLNPQQRAAVGETSD